MCVLPDMDYICPCGQVLVDIIEWSNVINDGMKSFNVSNNKKHMV